jgi:hypothetical protein
MKFVAPFTITVLISWVLYRQKGTWSPAEVYPKADYDRDAAGRRVSSTRRRSDDTHFYEESRDLLEDRAMGGVVKYPQQGGDVQGGFTKSNPLSV